MLLGVSGAGLQPLVDLGRHLDGTARPLPHRAFVAVEEAGEAALAPTKKVKTSAQAGWGHQLNHHPSTAIIPFSLGKM